MSRKHKRPPSPAPHSPSPSSSALQAADSKAIARLTTSSKAANVKSEAEDTGPTVLAVLRDIQAGTLHPASLAPADRQRCVEHMMVEGYSTTEIAELLKVAERTIIRDRKAIRGANSLRVDDTFVAETIGGLVKHAEVSVARLRRIARDRETPPAVKVDAERVGWEIQRDLVQALQRVGYLPTAAHEIRGELTHRIDNEVPSMDELSAELARIQSIATDSGSAVPAEVIDRLTKTKDTVARLSLSDTVQALAAAVAKPGSTDEPE